MVNIDILAKLNSDGGGYLSDLCGRIYFHVYNHFKSINHNIYYDKNKYISILACLQLSLSFSRGGGGKKFAPTGGAHILTPLPMRNSWIRHC